MVSEILWNAAQEFVESLDGIPDEAKQSLKQLTPGTYIGNATEQALRLKDIVL